MRADQTLVARSLARSRTVAQALIAAGRVRVAVGAGWTVVTKPAQDIPDGAEVQVEVSDDDRYVSRGGLKLAGALDRAGLDVAGLTCLDVGQSTGGFTEVLLAHGAAHVVGVDVGRGQLHPSLRGHAQVTVLEGINARGLTREALGAAMPASGFGLVVADLSFIPLTTVLPALVPLLAADGHLLALVKPQFELQPKDIGKGGLVKSAASYAEVQRKLRATCGELGLDVTAWLDSVVAGGDGNREFFICAVPAGRRLESDT